MVILRTLLKYSIEANVLLNPTDPRKATAKGISQALSIYLNLQKISLNLPIYPSAGTIATVPPIPGFSLVGANVIIPPASTLQSLIESNTRNSTPILSPIPTIGLFNAISTWLTGLTVNINSIGIPLVGATGVGVVTFPIMSILGLPCWSSMIGLGALRLLDPPNVSQQIDNAYEILSNFIYTGLVANFIAPIPTTGTIGSAYTGISFPLWVMLDVIDFPLGSANDDDVDEALSSMNLTSLDDLEGITTTESDSASATGDCSVVFTNGQYICPTDCSTYSTSIFTCAVDIATSADESNDFSTVDFTESSKYNSTDDLCDQSNSNLNDVSATGLDEKDDLLTSYTGSTTISDYDETPVDATTIGTFEINITVLRPTIKTTISVDVDADGIDDDSLFKTGFK